MVLFLIPISILFVTLLLKRREQASSYFRFSSSQLIKDLATTLKVRLSKLPIFLRGAALIFILLALARPQAPVEGSSSDLKGIDIILAIDTSTSMLAEDFDINGERMNRLHVTKMAVKEFANKRKGDRVGIVSFGSYAYTSCPLTIDYGWVEQVLDKLRVDPREDTTAIGYAIATSLNRLRDSSAKSKIIILLTDGRNNAGDISPQTATELAHSLGIKVYTIGVGTKGDVLYPFKDASGNKTYKRIPIDLDEDTLQSIAQRTGAKYFRAADTESLKNVYGEISTLEKSTFRHRRFNRYEELFAKFLIIALIILFLEIVLSNTILRKIP